MAWARALVDIACDLSATIAPDQRVKITLDQIAERFLNYYWNHTFFFNLKQGPVTPTIVSLVKELIQKYIVFSGSQRPIRYEKINFQESLRNDFDRCIKKIVSILKKDVSHRFLQLRGRDLGWMYEYKKNANSLQIKGEWLQILEKNKEILYPIINSRWAQIVESFDYSPRINKKVKFLNDAGYPREPLKRFRKWLDLANPDHLCFLCGNPIPERELSIDHVIPWSYLFEDNLWNLVYVHKRCNSSKSNTIPSEAEIKKLEARNTKLFQIFSEKGFYKGGKLPGKKIAEDLKFARENNLVHKFWIGCKG